MLIFQLAVTLTIIIMTKFIFSLKHLAGRVIARQSCLHFLLLLCLYEEDLLQYILCWLTTQNVVHFSEGHGHHHRLPQPLTSSAYYNYFVEFYELSIDQTTVNENIFTAYFKFDSFSVHWLEWFDSLSRCKILNTFTKSCLDYSEHQVNYILYVQKFCLHAYLKVLHTRTLYYVCKMKLFFQQGMAQFLTVLNTLPCLTSYKTFRDALIKSGNEGQNQEILLPLHRQFHLIKLIFLQESQLYPPMSQVSCPSFTELSKVLTSAQQKWLKSNGKFFPFVLTSQEHHSSKTKGWYICALQTPVLDKSCNILKNMLHALGHMRLGRLHFALVNWYIALSLIKHEPSYSLCRSFKVFVMSKFIQTLIFLHCPLDQLFPLFQSVCRQAHPFLDHETLSQTAHYLLMHKGAFQLSKHWLEELVSTTSFQFNRFAFEKLYTHVQECFIKLENVLAIELVRLLYSGDLNAADFDDLIFDPDTIRLNALNLKRFQPIQALLFRIQFLITQKIQPALQRCYFNCYTMHLVKLLKIHYDVIIYLVKKQELDFQWTLNTFSDDIDDLRQQINSLIDKPVVLPIYDSHYSCIEKFKFILDEDMNEMVLEKQCLDLLDRVILPRTLQKDNSVEEADYFFSFGVLAYGFGFEPSSVQYFSTALNIYQNLPYSHPRLNLCKLLSEAQKNIKLLGQPRDEVNQRLLKFDENNLVSAKDSKLLCTILKSVQQVQNNSVDTEVSQKSNQQWELFDFDHLKTITVFVSALRFNCPNGSSSHSDSHSSSSSSNNSDRDSGDN